MQLHVSERAVCSRERLRRRETKRAVFPEKEGEREGEERERRERAREFSTLKLQLNARSMDAWRVARATRLRADEFR